MIDGLHLSGSKMDLPVDYFPKAIDVNFHEILQTVQKDLHPTTFKLRDKSIEMRFRSVTYLLSGDKDKDSLGYYKDKITFESTPAPPIIVELQQNVQKLTGLSYSWVRIIFYRQSSDYIGFHRDREAIDSTIASVSLGVTRRFLMRADKDNSITSYNLHHGDLLVMRKGCQHSYKHSVPQMSLKDLVAHLEEKNIPIPKGRKTLAGLRDLADKNDAPLMRISLTFRE